MTIRKAMIVGTLYFRKFTIENNFQFLISPATAGEIKNCKLEITTLPAAAPAAAETTAGKTAGKAAVAGRRTSWPGSH